MNLLIVLGVFFGLFSVRTMDQEGTPDIVLLVLAILSSVCLGFGLAR